MRPGGLVIGASRLYRFGEFELDESTFELRRAGVRLDVQPRPLRLLFYLVENRKRVIGKQELFDQIWRDVIVSESALTSALRDVRRALGDDGMVPELIETLRNRGYRFVAPVEELSATDGELEEGAAPPRAPRRAALGAAAGVAIALAAAAAYLAMRTPTLVEAPLTQVAVLPFDDLSPGGDRAWLANGMTEDLIRMLNRIEAVHAMDSYSTAIVKRDATELAAIGQRLSAGSVVQGSVRGSGEELLVTVRLVRVVDGRQIWDGEYSEKLRDVFEIQRSIAEAIRVELGLHDLPWQRSRYEPEDPRAYERVRKAGDLMALTDYTSGDLAERLRRAIDYVEQALEIDPDYAEAHAQLGGYWIALDYYLRELGNTEQSQEYVARAAMEIERALELDETSPTAHRALANTRAAEWNWDEALRHFQLAVESDPGNAFIRENYSRLLHIVGRVENALVQARRAAELNPLWGRAQANLAFAQFIAGDVDGAVEQYEWAMEIDPRIALGVFPWLQSVYHAGGRDEEALDIYLQWFATQLEARKAAGGDPAVISRMEELHEEFRAGYERAGWSGLLRARLRLNADGSSDQGQPCPLAAPGSASLVYAELGEAERMFECLEVGMGRPGDAAASFPFHPLYDPYRGAPRFRALLRHMNLEKFYPL